MKPLKPLPPDKFQVVQSSGAGQHSVDYFCFEYTVHDRDILLQMAEVDLDELDLNRGRFERFSRYRQSCRITLPWNQSQHGPRLAYHGAIIQWIHDNLSGPWSLWADIRHVSGFDVEWSFERSSDAIMFKLVWG